MDKLKKQNAFPFRGVLRRAGQPPAAAEAAAAGGCSKEKSQGFV
jgi:hypothetical protein